MIIAPPLFPKSGKKACNLLSLIFTWTYGRTYQHGRNSGNRWTDRKQMDGQMDGQTEGGTD